MMQVLRRTGVTVAGVVAAIVLSGCGTGAADPDVPTPTPADDVAAAVTAEPDATDPVLREAGVSASDEPGHGAYTVEDLARASDAVVLTSAVSVLERVRLDGADFYVAEFAIDRVLRGASLEGASTVVAWAAEGAVPEASLTGRHVAFLLETPSAFDEEATDVLERLGGAHVLLPGPLAVLDIDGDTVSARDDSFQGLRDAYTIPPPSGSAPDATQFLEPGREQNRPSLDDVIAVIEGVDASSPPTSPAPVAPTTTTVSGGGAVPASLAEMDTVIPIVVLRTGPAESAGAYFGRSDPSGGTAGPASGFVPAAEDQLFCWAVEVINSRPQRIDEFEEVVVAGEYFRAIEPFASADALPHLRVLIDFTTSIADQGSFTEADEVGDGDPVGNAFAAMNTLVDGRCLGLD
ncbi:MAG: hypothetical protein U0Q03_11340 [Acidimicrobiales bacterium]